MGSGSWGPIVNDLAQWARDLFYNQPTPSHRIFDRNKAYVEWRTLALICKENDVAASLFCKAAAIKWVVWTHSAPHKL